MQSDQAKIGEVKRWRLEKKDERTGEVFEVLEGGDGLETRVLLRKAGQPASSYADLPFNGEPA